MDADVSMIPGDFMPVQGTLPAWIDIKQICRDAKRFVALHTLSNFNAVAINDGQRVYTTNDRDGEFRRHFRQWVSGTSPKPAFQPDPAEAALIYDCESHHIWLAPRPSAIQFLNLQV